jgi:hypothetical protein
VLARNARRAAEPDCSAAGHLTGLGVFDLHDESGIESLVPGGSRQVGDLYEIVARTPCPQQVAMRSRPVDLAAVPAVAVFEVADASLAAGAPLDELAEGRSAFVRLSLPTGFALAGLATVRRSRS